MTTNYNSRMASMLTQATKTTRPIIRPGFERLWFAASSFHHRTITDAKITFERIADAKAQLPESKVGRKSGQKKSDFNSVYAGVTEEIAVGLRHREWQSPEIMEMIVPIFAEPYFLAYTRWCEGSAPPAWQLAFDSEFKPGVSPAQAMLAGLVAHIVYDLGWAIGRTFEAYNRRHPQAPKKPARNTPEHNDFRYVNRKLSAVEVDEYPKLVTSGALLWINRVVDPLDRKAILKLIVYLRDWVWDQAVAAWDGGGWTRGALGVLACQLIRGITVRTEW